VIGQVGLVNVSNHAGQVSKDETAR
jgi:hypothetical protein